MWRPATAIARPRHWSGRFQVSVKFVNDMVRLKRDPGSLAARPQGNPGIGKLTPYAGWVRDRIDSKGDLTLDELVILLRYTRAPRATRLPNPKPTTINPADSRYE